MHFLAASRNGCWRAGAKSEGMLALAVGFDFAILRFEAVDVFPHGVEQELEMLRRHDDAGMDARPWHAGCDAREVDNKLGR